MNRTFKKTIEKHPLSISSSIEDSSQDFSPKYNTKKKEYHSKTFKDYHVNNLVDENKKNINLENKNQPFPQFSLNVNNPKSASSINHLTKMVIYFAMGILSKSGNSIIQLKKEFEKKYKKKIRINDRKKKLFLVLISNTFIFDQ